MVISYLRNNEFFKKVVPTTKLYSNPLQIKCTCIHILNILAWICQTYYRELACKLGIYAARTRWFLVECTFRVLPSTCTGLARALLINTFKLLPALVTVYCFLCVGAWQTRFLGKCCSCLFMVYSAFPVVCCLL